MLAAAVIAVVAAAVAARAAYLERLEGRVRRRLPLGTDGIVVGAETIDLPLEGAPAVLLIHGGGDTPQVMGGLAAFLHGRGFAVRVPLLSGHGRSITQFSEVKSERWHADVQREYAGLRETHGWVGIVGLSMGGALGIALTARRGDVPALVLLSPYVAMPRALERAARTSALWGLAYPYFSSRGSRSIQDPAAAARGLGHGVFTPAALRALHEVVRDGTAALPRVASPTLMMQSREDNRISVSAAEGTFEQLGSPDKKLEWLTGAGHVITVDYGHERVFAATAAWLETHGARPRGEKQDARGLSEDRSLA